jgi:hypothetical protein
MYAKFTSLIAAARYNTPVGEAANNDRLPLEG